MRLDLVWIAAGKPIVDLNIVDLPPAAPPDSLPKVCSTWCAVRVTSRSRSPNGAPPLPLLRRPPRPERPCRCCAAEQRDELATPHSIAPAARASSGDGISSSGHCAKALASMLE